MILRYFVFFKMTLFVFLLSINEIVAQEQSSYFLYQNGQPPIEGAWVSMDENTLIFKDLEGNEKNYARNVVDSMVLVKVNDFVEELKAIKLANPSLIIDEEFNKNDPNQEHRLVTTWGKRYRGIVTFINSEKLILTTQNGMELPYLLKEVKEIRVVKSDGKKRKNYKKIDKSVPKAKVEKRKEVQEEVPQAHVAIPSRIGIIPTAFNLQPGTVLYRNSATYLNEFLFAGKFFNVSGGNRIFDFFVKLQVTVPIRKYLHVSLLGEFNPRLNIIESLFSDARFAISPIVTIGTPRYFLNISYKTKAPLFLPINDAFDNSPIRAAKYFSFGGGVQLSKRLQFLTESMLIGEHKEQRHYRIYTGIDWHLQNQNIGFGVTIYDADNRGNTFSGPFSLNGISPSVNYTVRFR